MLRSINKDSPEVKLYKAGLELLRTGGLRAIGIEKLSSQSGVPRDQFEQIFTDKIDYLARLYFYNQDNANGVLDNYLDESGRLSREKLEEYLKFIVVNHPNILAYIDDNDVLTKVESRIRKLGGSEEKESVKLLSHYSELKANPDIAHFTKTLRFASLVYVSRTAKGDEGIDIGLRYLVSKMFRFI